MGDIQAPPGLAGVVVTDTVLGGVRGDEGFYHYREYSATELASRRTLEDVWYLFQTGYLPDDIQSKEFAERVAGHRAIPEHVLDLIVASTRLGSGRASLLWVRTAASVLAESLDTQTWLGRPIDEIANEAEHLVAALPTAVAAGWRGRQGLDPVTPDPQLPLATDFLRMLTRTTPDPEASRAFEQYLILTIDHGLNASTFAARSVASTGADVGSAIIAGIGSLSGPLHGGAPSLVLDMLQDIGTIDRARPWVRARLASGEPVMGFGHRVYRTDDPRAAMLKGVALDIGGPLVDLAVASEAVIVEELDRHRPDRDLRANVEFYAGVVLHLVGIPTELFPACFAMSRSIGWTAHILEQIANNRVIRPKAMYVGTPPPVSVP